VPAPHKQEGEHAKAVEHRSTRLDSRGRLSPHWYAEYERGLRENSAIGKKVRLWLNSGVCLTGLGESLE
jgi:hypothetical protein